MKTIWVFDIDSTIANNNHRAALLQKRCNVCLYSPMPQPHHAPCPNCGGTTASPTQESWDAFLDVDLVAKDSPIPGAIEVLDKLRSHGAEIRFLTGRNDPDMGDVTRAWLRDHAGWQEDSEPLYMRSHEERGLAASVYKERALKRLKDDVGEECLLVFFEDDPHVFNLYNKHGIVVKCPEVWQFFCPEGARGAEPKLKR